MSAPLVVNTADGTVWTRREGTRGGEALYAPEKCGGCPQFVMATLVELAEHGISGSADVLPMPVGPEPLSEIEHLRKQRDAFRDQRNAVFATNERLLAEVQESDQARLLAENETRTAKREVAELKEQRERRRARLVALQNDALSMRGSLSPNGEGRKVPFPLGETLTPAVDWLIARVAELEAERHVTNAALDDAVQALRTDRDRITALAERLRAGQQWQRGRNPELVSENFVSQSELRSIFGIPLAPPWADGIARRIVPVQALREDEPSRPDACKACGSAPETWCPSCGACQKGCYDGFVDNPCSHANASWGDAR